MCGIVGIVSQSPVNYALYDALLVLQHRGQDAAGIVTSSEKQVNLHKGCGLVREVFETKHMDDLKGNMGIGHVRYATSGSWSEAEAQPFQAKHPIEQSLVHNGNLTNTKSLKTKFADSDLFSTRTSSDSEVLLNLFASELFKQHRPFVSKSFFDCIDALYQQCVGAYSSIVMLHKIGLLGFRDPNGIRPLVYGQRHTIHGMDYMIASESCALEANGFELVRDLRPGEAVLIDKHGIVEFYQSKHAKQSTPCIFEYVYLSRTDSIIENASVYQTRLNMGEKLAENIIASGIQDEIDVVIPIPETSRVIALPLAQKLNKPYREGFVKNTYVGRTFIMPNQMHRERSVRRKLNVLPIEFKDKNILLVDDSIVRGTTSREIIKVVRAAGAKKVFIASAAPQIRFPNVYGIDMPSKKELVAHDCNDREIAETLGADAVIYQRISDLKSAVTMENPELTSFDTSIFDGDYVTGIESDYFDRASNRLYSIESSIV